jgi:hypothetical protein
MVAIQGFGSSFEEKFAQARLDIESIGGFGSGVKC